jgi:PAS domain S-box-containing protein
MDMILAPIPILLVDDDPHARETLRDVLESEGYRVHAVGVGAQAIEEVRRRHYDAALVDIRLPDLDGLIVLEILLQLDPKLPVILLSGYATVENTVQALNRGAFAYVLKPYNLDEVKATLRRAIEMKTLAMKAERAELQLRESEERFRSVVQSATDAIILADGNGSILSWNNGARRLFLYTEQEILGEPLARLLPESYRAAHEQGMAREKGSGPRCMVGRTLEMHGLRKDGTQFPLELSIATWQTKDATFYSGIIRDITERKQGEEALRRAYHETENILASLPSSIFIVNENRQIVYANSLASHHFGLAGASLLGRCIFDIVPIPRGPWDRLAANLPFSASHNGHPVHDGEFESRKSIYQYRMFPVALYGTDEAQTGVVISDITEQKQLQDQLIQAEKLSSLGTLVSGMAHEINNPMHGILAMAEIILEETDPEKIREYAQDIVSYSKHAATVVRDFACYARPASGDREVEIDLNERLLEALKMVRRNPQFGDIEIVKDFAPLPSLWVRRSEIDQVFVNLISNAAHAMAGQGCLTLRTCADGDRITASITDTGSGIPRANLSRIFDPFFTTKDPGKGTGLGLSIVYKIVSKYEGTLTVDSEEDKGATFSIHFPAAKVCRKEAHHGVA